MNAQTPITPNRTYNVLNSLMKFHAFPNETDGKFCLIEATVPVGQGAPAHSHAGETEAFYVMEGHVTFIVGDEEISAEAGAFVAIPDGAVHAFVAEGDTPARLLVLNAPGNAHAQFFTAVGEAVPDTTSAPLPPSAPNFPVVMQEAAAAGITIMA